MKSVNICLIFLIFINYFQPIFNQDRSPQRKVNYCRLNCPNNKPQDHTLCKYSWRPAAACGKEWIYRPLTYRDRTNIVKVHNDFRGKVSRGLGSLKYFFHGINSSSASNMMMLKWDVELAYIAQRWANQCNPVPDDCRSTGDEMIIGQSIGYIQQYGHFKNLLQSILYKWYGQIFSAASNDVLDWEETDSSFVKKKFRLSPEYYQMIWATTQYVGCGRFVYRTNQKYERSIYQFKREAGPHNFNGPEEPRSSEDNVTTTEKPNAPRPTPSPQDITLTELLVCNYKIGMKEDGTAYKPGPTCSDCPHGSLCNPGVYGLCFLPDSALSLHRYCLWPGNVLVTVVLVCFALT